MIYSFQGITPTVGKEVFIAPSASVIGDVTLEDGVSIWFGAVLRGDIAPITVGRDSNIQDNCTVHTDHGRPAIIGSRVTVGHNAVVHGCIVEEGSLIGIGAIILTGARIRTGSVVAAGSVVREGQEIGPYHMVAGVPAAFKMALNAEMRKRLEVPIQDYRQLAARHALGQTAG